MRYNAMREPSQTHGGPIGDSWETHGRPMGQHYILMDDPWATRGSALQASAMSISEPWVSTVTTWVLHGRLKKIHGRVVR